MPRGKSAPNYSIVYVNGTLTVNKATLTIKANDSKTTAPEGVQPPLHANQPVTANGDTITGVTETSGGAVMAEWAPPTSWPTRNRQSVEPTTSCTSMAH